MVTGSLGFLFIAPAVWGLLVSLVEIFFVMQDEGGMHPLSHGIHAIPTCIIFAYISMNAPAVGNFLSNYVALFSSAFFSSIFIPIAIGLIATFKVKAAAAIVGGHGSVGEKLGHAFIIGILIAIAPFVWVYVAPFLPSIINM